VRVYGYQLHRGKGVDEGNLFLVGKPEQLYGPPGVRPVVYFAFYADHPNKVAALAYGMRQQVLGAGYPPTITFC
jgi:hypothetical protein